MLNLDYPEQLQAAQDGSVTVTFPQVSEAITQGIQTRPMQICGQ